MRSSCQMIIGLAVAIFELALMTTLTNLSSTVVTQLRLEPEEAFPRTLGRVKAEMREKKGAISAPPLRELP